MPKPHPCLIQVDQYDCPTYNRVATELAQDLWDNTCEYPSFLAHVAGRLQGHQQAQDIYDKYPDPNLPATVAPVTFRDAICSFMDTDSFQTLLREAVRADVESQKEARYS